MTTNTLSIKCPQCGTPSPRYIGVDFGRHTVSCRSCGRDSWLDEGTAAEAGLLKTK